MRKVHILALLVASLLTGTALAQTEIHKCADADGGVVYSQLPCKDEVPTEAESPADSDAADNSAPWMERAESLPAENATEEPETSESRAACMKRYRDAIDTIDAEIRREYSKDKDGEYKQRLLALTRKLRAC